MDSGGREIGRFVVSFFVIYIYIVERIRRTAAFGGENLGPVLPGSGNAFLGNPSLRMFEGDSCVRLLRTREAGRDDFTYDVELPTSKIEFPRPWRYWEYA